MLYLLTINLTIKLLYQNLTNNENQRFLVPLNLDSSWGLKYKIPREGIIYCKSIKGICGGKIQHARHFMPKCMLLPI